MEDLQNLLEKINREGVEKAEAEATRIIADAKAKADALLKDAAEKAQALKTDAERNAAASTQRANETIRQGARDLVLSVKASLDSLFEKVLLKDVEKALDDEATIKALVTEAIKGVTGPVEVALPAKLAPTLKAQLAASGNITVVTDESLGQGFSVKTDLGRVESAFTAQVVASEIARRLRPDLAELLK